MKVNIIIKYAGQTQVFKDLEFDDEELVDESYQEGIDENDERIFLDFSENYQVEIERLTHSPGSYTKEDYLADRADTIRKYGKEG